MADPCGQGVSQGESCQGVLATVFVRTRVPGARRTEFPRLGKKAPRKFQGLEKNAMCFRARGTAL